MGSESSKPQVHFPCRVDPRSRRRRNPSNHENPTTSLESCLWEDPSVDDGSDTSFKWPGNTIPYLIDENLFPHRVLISNINEAINQFHKQTMIQFIPYQPNQGLKDWVLFTFHPEYTDSYIGRLGGRQEIRISPKAKKGNVMHEIMHTIGFCHEQSRIDRDRIISVDLDRLPKGENKANYEIEGIPLGAYDPDSIMQYEAGKVIKAKIDLPNKMGQRDGFSKGDLKAIKYLCLSPICTYDVFVEEHFVQKYYECITCWGSGSEYGVCEYCKYKCHKGHKVKAHEVLEQVQNRIELMCNCGRNRHIVPTCSVISTGQRKVKQMFYQCNDCFDVEDYVRTKNATPMVCKPCYVKCHDGHRYVELGVYAGVCVCAETCCKTLCKAR